MSYIIYCHHNMVLRYLCFFFLNAIAFKYTNNYMHLIRPSGIIRKGPLYLDLEDIIDDDVDFLLQLRKQIENPLNASPREVTNRIKDFFSGNKRSQKELDVFRTYLEANKHVFDVVNAILILEGCDKIDIPVEKLVPGAIIYNAVGKASPLLTSSMVYRGINCLKKMNPENENTKKYLSLLWERIKESEILMHVSDICPSIYSIQNFSTKIPEVRKLILLFANSLAASNEVISSKTVSSAIYGMRKMRSSVPEVRELLSQIAIKINNSETFYHSVNICIALNGLQLMDDSFKEVRAILSALMDKAIPAHEQGIDKAGDREISMALFGLQRMGGKFQGSDEKSTVTYSKASPELRRVVTYISSLIVHHDNASPFEAKRLGFALCGISSMSHEMPELQSLITVLAVKMKTCWGDMNGHELSMCMHGLANLQSDSRGVRDLVSGLVPLVAKCPGMGSKDAISAVSGLQGMRSSSKEVCKLATELAGLIDRSNITVTDPIDAGSLMYGLQGLSSKVPEVRKLLITIPKVIGSVKPISDGRALAMLIGGLKSCNSKHPETLKIIETITPRIVDFQGVMSANNVAIALYGLQELRSGPREVSTMIAALTPHVANAKGKFNPKGLSMAMNGLQGLSSSDPAVRSLVAALTSLIDASDLIIGFDDFHQLSATYMGLASMSVEYPEVLTLVTSLSRVVESQNNITKRRPGHSYFKTDRVGMAFYGLKGMSWHSLPVKNLMVALIDPVKQMAAPDGKALGMMLQGFLSCSGAPPEPLGDLLTEISKKTSGWSRRMSIETTSSSSNVSPETNEDRQASLRSCLWGTIKINRKHTSVRAILKSLAIEIMSWECALDDKTLQAIREAYRGEKIEDVKEISILLEKIQNMKNNTKRWNRKIVSDEDNTIVIPASSIEMEIDSKSLPKTWTPKNIKGIQEEVVLDNSLGRKLILDEMKDWIGRVKEESNLSDKNVNIS